MQPRVGLGVFIFRSPGDSRFVLGKRKGSIGAGESVCRYDCTAIDRNVGTWALPGGHLEHGETFEQCAVREVAEETGMEIEDVKFLTATESIFEADQKHYVTIFVKAFASKSPGGDEPKVCRFRGRPFILDALSGRCELC